jgi:hypothetical protein
MSNATPLGTLSLSRPIDMSWYFKNDQPTSSGESEESEESEFEP